MATGGYLHRFDIDDQHSVHLYRGSLVDVQADALVSSDDNYLSAGGGVSAALAEVAGVDVARERHRLTQDSSLRLGDVVRTSAGGLPCQFLYPAITIEDFRRCLGEATLRVLVANLLERATQDGIHTLGMPALGTGVAGFDIARASEIIIEELLGRLVSTPIRHVVLALVGDDAQRHFYEQLVRANAPRCAVSSLRRIEKQLVIEPAGQEVNLAQPMAARAEKAQNPSASAEQDQPALPSPPARGPGPVELAEETGEQFPSLIDATRLAATPRDRPRLVSGLVALMLKHSDPADIEEELLGRPECYGFRGTIEQRLMEFLYLNENNLRTALGPALFKARDLRRIVEELGEDCELARDAEQLIDLILRALCFNLLAAPVGLSQYIARIERLILGLDAPDPTPATRIASGLEAAKVLELVLKDLLRLYGYYLFGPSFEQALVQHQVVPPRRDGSVMRLTLGQVRDALAHLETLAKKKADLGQRLAQLGRDRLSLLPSRFTVELKGEILDGNQVLTRFTRWRNQEIAHDDPAAPPAPDQRAVREHLEHLRAFLLSCRAEGVYPEVLRYEGTFENRNGERFVHFLDERNTERKVRTDEKIDPRRHYYCFATNNPVHLFPVLVPKA